MRNRVRDPEYYRDGAVYEAVKALNGADAIGDPDDLVRLAEAVIDALSARTPNGFYQGWLLAREEAYRVIDVDHAGGDGHSQCYTVSTEAREV